MMRVLLATTTAGVATALLLTGCSAQSTPGPVKTDPATSPVVLTANVDPYGPGVQPVPGTLVVTDGCVALEADDGNNYPILWDTGTVLSNDDTVELGASKIKIGTALPNAAGYLVEAGSLGDEVVGLSDCTSGPEDVVFVNPSDMVPTIVGQ